MRPASSADIRLLPAGPVPTRRALEDGFTRRDLAGPLWRRLHRGVHADSALDAADPDVRISAVAALLPAGPAIGGWAGLRLLGAAVLDGGSGAGGGKPWPVAVREGVVSSPEVRRHLAGTVRQHGAPRARMVATLVDGRSASILESVMKVVWVVQAGLAPPLVNRLLVDDRGEVLGEPDLLDRESGLVGEYDGSTHRDLASHAWDNHREERFEDHNLVVVRATSLDLWPRRAELVRRLLAGHRRGMARDRTRDRWGVQVPNEWARHSSATDWGDVPHRHAARHAGRGVRNVAELGNGGVHVASAWWTG